MKDKNTILNEIFENDPLEILKVSLKNSDARTSDERLASSFDEINNFLKKMSGNLTLTPLIFLNINSTQH